MSELYWLTDVQMERLRPFFPKSRGNPRADDRRSLSLEFMANRKHLKFLTRYELLQAREEVERAIGYYEQRKLREAQVAADKVARRPGFSLSQLKAVGPVRGRKQVFSGSYANPADPCRTWHGRGRRPRWFKDPVETGGDIDELRV